MTGSRSDNEVLLVPDTVKEGIFLCKLQRSMYEDGYDVREEAMKDDRTGFVFAVLKRPGPRKKQAQSDVTPEQPDTRTMSSEFVQQEKPPE